MARLDIDVRVDPNGEVQIKKLDQSINKLEGTTQKANKTNTAFNEKLLKVSAAAASVGFALQKVIDTGFTYNRQIENATNGLTALIAATSQNVTTTGRMIDQQQLYSLASKEAAEAVELLRVANLKTPQSLNETIDIYKVLLPTLRSTGATQEELVGITEKLSIASAAYGVSTQSLLAGVDGLASGTVLANSDFGRFLKTIGLGNDELKNTNDIIGLLNDKLSKFEAIQSYDIAFSNLKNTIVEVFGDATQELFEDTVIAFEDINKWIIANKDDIVEFGKDTVRVFDIITQAITIGLQNNMLLWDKFLLMIVEAANKILPDFAVEYLNLNEKIKEYSREVEIGTIQQGLLTDRFKDTLEAITNDTTATQKNTQAKQINTEKTIAAIEAKKEDLETIIRVAEETDKLNELICETYEETERIANEAIKDSENAWLQYFTNIGNKEEAWAIRSKQIIDEYSKYIGEEKAKEMADALEENFMKKSVDEAEESANAIYEAFNGAARQMENSFMDFFDTTSKGFGDFGALAKNILNDIMNQIIRTQIVAPLVGGITGLFTQGGAFQGGREIAAFASGGVVSSPTFFPMANGTGLLGEAGPEAIMPLTRIGGDLGVKAVAGNTYINIKNESGMALDAKVVEETNKPNGDHIKTVVLQAMERDYDFRQAIRG